MAMDWYKAIKRYYDIGIYSKADVAVFVVKGRITADQYKQITGEDFQAEE